MLLYLKCLMNKCCLNVRRYNVNGLALGARTEIECIATVSGEWNIE